MAKVNRAPSKITALDQGGMLDGTKLIAAVWGDESHRLLSRSDEGWSHTSIAQRMIDSVMELGYQCGLRAVSAAAHRVTKRSNQRAALMPVRSPSFRLRKERINQIEVDVYSPEGWQVERAIHGCPQIGNAVGSAPMPSGLLQVFFLEYAIRGRFVVNKKKVPTLEQMLPVLGIEKSEYYITLNQALTWVAARMPW